MKKTTRNILAMALATHMTVSLAACGSKKKDDGSASAAGGGSGSTGAATAGDSTGGAKAASSGSGKIVKESDPYFLVNAAKLQAKINQEKEVSLDVLLRICDYLRCNIGDICDAVKVNRQ